MGIAIYQILGALVIFYLIYSIVDDITPGIVFALIPIGGLCLVSLFAGIFFFIKGINNDLRFFTLSKLNFCAQFLVLSVPGFAFHFYYGPFFAMGFDGDFNFMFRAELLTADFGLKFGETDAHYVLLNFIPLVPLLKLRRVERSLAAMREQENAFVKE